MVFVGFEPAIATVIGVIASPKVSVTEAVLILTPSGVVNEELVEVLPVPELFVAVATTL